MMLMTTVSNGKSNRKGWDSMIKSPAYAVIYDVLKREIMDGDIPVGSLLPAEPELEKRFSVSRTTVRRAVELLSQDGLVLAKQGRGTKVLDYKTRQNLNMVTSISETLRKKGYEVRPKTMHIDIVPASSHIAQDLGIDEGEPVARVQRIQLADEHPVAIMKNYIPAYMVPGIESQVENINSLYMYLEERYSINIDSAKDRISARSADFSEAQMLEIPVGGALLYMRRICYSNNRPVCADRLSIVGDKYELQISMIGRSKESI